MTQYDTSIHQNPSAEAWTRFFYEHYPDCNVESDVMLGWFANAMMAMHDHLKSKEIEPLQQACEEWAEVSQRNYQCAKLYFEALQLIAAPTYGIQSIMEDYEIDSIPYLEAALSYYYKLVTSYQATARSAIAGVEGVEDDEEFGC